ncbi:YheC/YheD family protein [Evansella cellulosilytica]|uniref:ATP-grasp domain-containing protein n=1 Tax=Evansella cellulosilytica (strain ATCC 21833 / DSM 2522 / FERM P-1141 / JCM 9156 / N-4) TaxID=649639 RepID=E6TWC2_EVAC2|nr:YheC/YheD family protein [Evansella cellulosilytica]ADU31078.1 hypothetical protein Bcell_2825 [Evansella cellulosilytica DSM 2522]
MYSRGGIPIYHCKNKQHQYHVLGSNEVIKPFLPETKPYSKIALRTILFKYNEAMIKPTIGSSGSGIIKVRMSNNERYDVFFKDSQQSFSRLLSVHAYIKSQIKKYARKKSSSSFIIQQVIPLIEIDGDPVDIRVIVQRTKENQWQVSGKYARKARNQLFTTNLKQGGTAFNLKDALHFAYLPTREIQVLEKKIDDLSLTVVGHLSHIWKVEHVWGIDLGLDKKGHLWIIEANIRPRFRGFKEVDRHTYEKIDALMTWHNNKHDD